VRFYRHLVGRRHDITQDTGKQERYKHPQVWARQSYPTMLTFPFRAAHSIRPSHRIEKMSVKSQNKTAVSATDADD
jgi:hypothetical protein